MKKLTIILAILLFTSAVYPCAPRTAFVFTGKASGFRRPLYTPVKSIVVLTKLDSLDQWLLFTDDQGQFQATLPCGPYLANAFAEGVPFVPTQFNVNGLSDVYVTIAPKTAPSVLTRGIVQ